MNAAASHPHHGQDGHDYDLRGASAPTSATATRDPVCGMSVDRATAHHHAQHAGVDYYFCSAKCRQKFTAQPQQYLQAHATAPVAALPNNTIYTCPMHPQIRQPAPGNCSICGMTLEPLVPTLE